jgi:hypothetical protein
MERKRMAGEAIVPGSEFGGIIFEIVYFGFLRRDQLRFITLRNLSF